VTQLDELCEGKAVPSAAAYDGAKGAHNAAIVVHQDLNSSEWTPMLLGDDYDSLGAADGKRLRKADAIALVVCVRPTESKKVRDCKFGKGRRLELHDAAFEIRVLEAKTAKVLATEKVQLEHELKQCTGRLGPLRLGLLACRDKDRGC
jgi:hypothetical protein